jgi:hypothetical protein
MEGLVRTSTDINWTIHGGSVRNPLTRTVGSTILNKLPLTYCVFTAVCDWNLIMASCDQAFSKQCHAIQVAMNT